jgi:hypothetical protein
MSAKTFTALGVAAAAAAFWSQKPAVRSYTSHPISPFNHFQNMRSFLCLDLG